MIFFLARSFITKAVETELKADEWKVESDSFQRLYNVAREEGTYTIKAKVGNLERSCLNKEENLTVGKQDMVDLDFEY